MRFSALFLLLGLSLMFNSCDKEQNRVSPTPLPQDMASLVGSWKVAKYVHHSFSGEDTSKPPYFDSLSFTETKVAVYRDDVRIGERKFHFSKDATSGQIRFTLAGEECGLTAQIDHYISIVSDTLLLHTVLVDAGTDYWLVRK